MNAIYVLVSFLTGDSSMEVKVDENLLVNFKDFYRWNRDPNLASKPENYSDNHFNMVGVTN